MGVNKLLPPFQNRCLDKFVTFISSRQSEYNIQYLLDSASISARSPPLPPPAPPVRSLSLPPLPCAPPCRPTALCGRRRRAPPLRAFSAGVPQRPAAPHHPPSVVRAQTHRAAPPCRSRAACPSFPPRCAVSEIVDATATVPAPPPSRYHCLIPFAQRGWPRDHGRRRRWPTDLNPHPGPSLAEHILCMEAAPRQIRSSLRCVMAWPELRVVGPILAALLRTWPLEWISLCTTFPLPQLDPEVDTGMFDPEENN